MADAVNVLVICGSLRKGSFNRMLVNALPALKPAEMNLTESPSVGTLPLYNADIQSSTGDPPEVVAMVNAVRAADGVLFVSPEYNWSIPGTTKNAIDWVSRVKDQPWANKPTAIQSAAPGLLGGARMQYHLRQSLTSVDAVTLIRPEVFVNLAAKKFDEKTGELTDQPTRDIVKQQLEAFVKFIRRMKQ
jgi:chromate reductase, NAD(P)H dehydrogenase (quinone)